MPQMSDYSDKYNSDKYDGYTMGLALVDLAPVLLFLMSGLIMYSMYGSPLLLAGVLACFTGGLSKVIWKMIIAAGGKDRPDLTRAFRILMPAGFALMIISVAAGGRSAFSGLWRSLTMMPAAVLFAAGFALMCLMGYLGRRMDDSARSNWIEELVNTLAQLAVLAGVIVVYFGTYYHADAAALAALRGTEEVRVTEIARELDGSEDKVLDADKYGKALADGLWPADFTEVVLKGGNHAGFGNYGDQKGDGRAALTAAVQQKETAEAICAWAKRGRKY